MTSGRRRERTQEPRRLSSSPSDAHESQVPEEWAEAVVLESVHCRKCGYDLRGLQAGGLCPECGLDIWSSVQHTVDPTASRLPSIRNPRAVGNAVFWLTLCLLAGMVVMMWPVASELVRDFSRGRWRVWPHALNINTWFWAAVIGIVGLLSVRTLAPPRGAEPGSTVWKDIWRIAVGFSGALVFGALWVQFIDAPGLHGVRQRLAIHLAAASYATISLMGLRSVFNVIGQRSREYRRSQGGRQNLELVIAALVAGFLAAMLHYFARMQWLPRMWINLSRMAMWASHFMVLIGLAYMLVNAWWIRQALRKPPPAVDQVLAPNLPPDTWIPDREE